MYSRRSLLLYRAVSGPDRKSTRRGLTPRLSSPPGQRPLLAPSSGSPRSASVTVSETWRPHGEHFPYDQSLLVLLATWLLRHCNAHAWSKLSLVPNRPGTKLGELAMWKERLAQVIFVSRTVFKWGWLPLLLYLGEWKHKIC